MPPADAPALEFHRAHRGRRDGERVEGAVEVVDVAGLDQLAALDGAADRVAASKTATDSPASARTLAATRPFWPCSDHDCVRHGLIVSTVVWTKTGRVARVHGAENQIEIAAPPERVWAVLADPQCFDDWVVGAQDVRDADASWPAVGSKLHHSTGVGPLTVDDETAVEVAEPPTRLVLLARARRGRLVSGHARAASHCCGHDLVDARGSGRGHRRSCAWHRFGDPRTERRLARASQGARRRNSSSRSLNPRAFCTA